MLRKYKKTATARKENHLPYKYLLLVTEQNNKYLKIQVSVHTKKQAKYVDNLHLLVPIARFAWQDLSVITQKTRFEIQHILWEN